MLLFLTACNPISRTVTVVQTNSGTFASKPGKAVMYVKAYLNFAGKSLWRVDNINIGGDK
jgi:hypothetical protein